ncbi:hypothetical protein D3C79_563470 [compost metagenome]
MHQPFGLGQFGEGFGKAPFAAILRSDHAMADQHADVAAGPCFDQTCTQTAAPGFRLQARDQQIAFVQGQACPRRVQALRRQPLQTLQTLAHFIECPQHFAASMQHPRAIVMCQGFEQWVADPLSQLQRLAVPAAGPREVSVGNRQVGNRRQAHQALAIALLRQAAQGFDAIGAGAFAIATAAGDDPTQGQPLRQHRTLGRRRRRWQEATQVTGQLFGGVQLPGQAQGPAVQHNQPWRADQQAIGQVHLPAQQHTDVLLGQQLLFGKVLHQVGGDIQVPCPQGLLHRLVE